MIPFASQRGGGQDLSKHLQDAHGNEITEVFHIRGAVAPDLSGAFEEWEVQANALTRCKKYLYSLSVNPDPAQGPLTREQYLDYIARTESALGLSDQPRAIVFHTKFGREHCHVVWSRIDADRQKAVHLAFDREKLMQVTRAFARDHGLSLPAGYDKSRHVGQVSLYEKEQERQTGLSKADHSRAVTEAWKHSDDARSFVQALAERGYILATGKRPYILVDLYGGMNALPKLIDDKAVRTKDIRAFLEKDYHPDSLPSVEEAEQLVDRHRKQVECALREEEYAGRLAELKHRQHERRASTTQQVASLTERHRNERVAQQRQHRDQRDGLRSAHRRDMQNVRDKRYENRATGLAAFLGRVSGVELIRKVWHRHEDAKRVKAYIEQRRELKVRQEQERQTLSQRMQVQMQEVERKEGALEKIDKRELAAFMRDQRTEQRVRDRVDGRMPSLVETKTVNRQVETQIPNVLAAFDQARQGSQNQVPDLMAEFSRASLDRLNANAGEDSHRIDGERNDAAVEVNQSADKGRDVDSGR